MKLKIILILTVILSCTINVRAWVYPEHRDITVTAIQRLDPVRKHILDQIWADARRGYETRLTVAVADVKTPAAEYFESSPLAWVKFRDFVPN